jgi:putative FmdB family regulatory protein
MPIYEYACNDCETKFEKLVRSMSSDEKVPCPKCGSKKTARTLSLIAATTGQDKTTAEAPPMCGRCGGPGPCAMGD